MIIAIWAAVGLFGGFTGHAGAAAVGAASPFTWEAAAGFRSSPLKVPQGGRTGLQRMPNTDLGIQFTNTLAIEAAKTNNNLMNGAGVAAGDFDGDGWCDLYFCNLGGQNVLYRNLGGWKFADVTTSAGATLPPMASTGAVFADLDGDGWLDLVVTACGGPNAVLMNDGHGKFQLRTTEAGLVSDRGGTSMALADIDGDGDLDLYVANYANLSILRSGGAINIRMIDGKPTVIGPYSKRIRVENGRMRELGEPDVLYLNDGHGVFTPVSWTSGAFLDEDGHPLTAAPEELGLSVLFHDLNGDGAPDLYVCNDYEGPDRIWINDGKGHFRALPRLSIRQTSQFSMSADVADVNRDGLNDLFVVDMLSRFHPLRMTQMGVLDPPTTPIGVVENRPQIRRNTLQIAREDGTFAELANRAGVAASDWSWCSVFLDVDLDGYEDLLVANGHAFDIQDTDTLEAAQRKGRPNSVEESRNALLQFPALETPNYVFRNERGTAFTEVGKDWGFNSTQVSHGIALADLDNDGDLDVVVNCLNAPPLLYRNETSAGRVMVRTRGTRGNTQGIGARVELLGGPVRQSQEIISGGRYLSSDEPVRTFATGSATNDLTLLVHWRDGRESRISGVQPNRVYEISVESATPPIAAMPPPVKPLFEDVSGRLGHQHHEDPFDDFARQPLLPRRLSQLGPGVSWLDLDRDGWDDVILGSGRGGPLAALRNDHQGGFVAWTSNPFAKNTAGDHVGLVGFHEGENGTVLLVGRSNYEDEDPLKAPSVVAYHLRGGVVDSTDRLAGIASSVGPLSMADLDGDGDLDLFVGGRVIPGRYPMSAESRVFWNESGRFTEDTTLPPALRQSGMVSGSILTDLDGDGLPELVLACEWGGIRIWAREKGSWVERSAAWGVDRMSGWWTSVQAGDFDGDGRMDLIVGNWGLNSAYHATTDRPERLAFGEWSGGDTLDLLETEPETSRAALLPRRDMIVLGAVWPELRARFPTHRAYSTATVATLLGSRAESTAWLEATSLQTTLLLQRHGHLEIAPLPDEAQWAPVFGAVVADFDGDGAEDIVLAQNFFANAPDMPRLDAGRGLLLKGDGQGAFVAVSGSASGIKVYGEQRGAACADYDQDGRTDLLITQNGGETRLYRNQGGRTGLRVRLAGPPSNPDGTGAVLRLKSGSRWGASRELHAGSGYWSQDSSIQVLTAPFEADEISVRWPGGRTTVQPIPRGTKELVVRHPDLPAAKGNP